MAPPPPLADAATRRLAGAPPGPRRRDLKRNAILDAAAALFVENGVASTSVDDIVERAGVAKGTFYHYFQDRAGMLEALRRRYSQQFADAAAEAIAACGTDPCPRQCWAARLDAWIATVAAEYLASYALHDAIFHDAAVCHRCVMSEEAVVQGLAALLAEGKAAGVWSLDDPLSVAVFMFHGLHGLVDEAIATGADTARVSPQLSGMFAAMLRPQ